MRYAPLLLCSCLAGCGPSDADKYVQIGHVCPPGPIGDEELALKLAVEELNLDMSRQPEGKRVVIKHAPGGATPVEWSAQATRFVSLNKVNGLIANGGEAEAEKIGLAIQGESVVGLSTAGWAGGSSRNLFTVGIAPSERGRVLAMIAKEMKVKSVLIMREQSAKGANLAADRFATELRDIGIKIGEVDVAAAEKPAAEMVFLACSGKGAIQLRPKGSKAFFGGDDNELPILLGAGAAADGIHIASAGAPVGQTEPLSTFIEKFRAAHGRRTPSVDAILAHDALAIWVEAARRAKSYDATAIRDELRKHDPPFNSLTGPIVFASDQTARRPVFTWQLSGGQLMEPRRFDPESAK